MSMKIEKNGFLGPRRPAKNYGQRGKTSIVRISIDIPRYLQKFLHNVIC